MLIVCPKCNSTLECFENIELVDVVEDGDNTIIGVSFDCGNCENTFTFEVNFEPLNPFVKVEKLEERYAVDEDEYEEEFDDNEDYQY